MSIFPRVTQRSLRREPSPPFRLTREVAGVLLITFGLLVLLSVGSFSPTDVPLFSDAEAQDQGKLGGPQNLVGVVGATLAFGLYWLVGSAALAVPFLIVLQGIRAFREEEMEAKLRSVVGSVMTVVFLSALIYLYGSPGTGSGDVAAIGLSGGVSGQLVATLLEQYFAGMGSLILLLSGLLVSLLLVAPFSVAAVMRRVPDWWAA
ncbi:MAG: DNA translocase FtsK 4TM domain-containing protein, partial [Nitrospirota bacterium]|nr:DNA translocase FtsK 4TM domain-containing protein [Nitrospirota bacterium]